ncbi:MAG: DMT family transporter [Elioraea sp.]|nr:DMT family transporter [Elioraea sp.]
MTSPLGAVFTGLLARALIGEPLPRRRLVGLGMIAAGAAAIVAASVDGLWGPKAWIGHLLFTAAGLLWAAYTVSVRATRIGVLDAVTLSVVGSAAAFSLPYLAVVGPRFLAAPLWEVAIQALLHGVLGATLSVILFNKGLVLVGATRAAAVGALTPTLTAVFGVVVLGEVPSPPEVAGIAVLTLGVVLASVVPPTRPLAPAPPRP